MHGRSMALLVLVVCSLQFSQFILRMGGTDAQWFWFSSEPKGLAALRDQAPASSASARSHATKS